MIKCKHGFEVTVLRSEAGYYIGTLEDGAPSCRITGYGSEETMKAMLPRVVSEGFPFRDCYENNFCGNGNCEIKEVAAK